MSVDPKQTIKRRGVASGRLTRLDTRLRDLEKRDDLSLAVCLESARQMRPKIASINSEFREHHSALVDMLDDDGELDKQQRVIDNHDDQVTNISARVECLINCLSALPPTRLSMDQRNVSLRFLHQVDKGLSKVDEVLSAKPSDMCAVKQLEEEIADLKSDVRSASRDLALLDLDEYDDLLKLEKALKGFTVTHYRRSILCHPRPLSLHLLLLQLLE